MMTAVIKCCLFNLSWA